MLRAGTSGPNTTPSKGTFRNSQVDQLLTHLNHSRVDHQLNHLNHSRVDQLLNHLNHTSWQGFICLYSSDAFPSR